MKINDYQVHFGITHAKLDSSFTSVQVRNNELEMKNGEISSLKKVTKKDLSSIDDKLSQQLQVAILKKINSTKNQSVVFEDFKAEYEELNFKTKGVIKADNKELSIDINVNLKRSFVKTNKINKHRFHARDPLIISLDGSMPNLSKKKFIFDIDSDGQVDQISKLRQNSGFLALDRNKNGKIDNGSELFGTKSGDGFADLKAYDDDQNGWIDENDKIFDKLRIWQKTDTKDKLVGLGEVGIGAIFLGNAKTEFSIKDLQSDKKLGKIKSNSFFIFENGQAGVISQIDLDAKKVWVPHSKKEQFISKLKKVSTNIKIQKVYKQDTKEKSVIEKIQDKIKVLEGKLLNASNKDADNIRLQIMLLRTQLLALMKLEII